MALPQHDAGCHPDPTAQDLAARVQTLEFHVPKLARTELTRKGGQDLLPKVLIYKVEP